MTKEIFASCLAAAFLLSGAAINQAWAVDRDSITSGQIILAEGEEGDANEGAPQSEQEGGGEQDGHLINVQPTFDVAQSEEGEAAEPQPEEGGQGEGGGN